LVVDTGVVYALLDRSDAWHERARGAWDRHGEALVIPAPVVVEVCQLLAYRLGTKAEHGFLAAAARGEFLVESLEPGDYLRAAELVDLYADLPLGFVDAAVVAVAERLEVDRVLTTDRRHFSVIRPRHVQRLVLEP
jgi:predicted nucleic acid-binding protein